MNTGLDRQFFAQVVVVLAVCIGGWMMFIEPRAEELAQLDAVIEQGASGLPDMPDEAVMSSIVERLSSVEDRVTKISRASAYALNTSTVYGQLTDIAAAHNVELKNLTPGQRTLIGPDQSAYITPLTMTLSGDYEAIARFIDELDGFGAYIRARSLSITPLSDQGRDIITARVTCEALGFDLPPALAAMKGNVGADT